VQPRSLHPPIPSILSFFPLSLSLSLPLSLTSPRPFILPHPSPFLAEYPLLAAMPLAGHSEILPLHGQKYRPVASIQAHVRTVARRITPARALIAFCIFLSLYILAQSTSSSNNSNVAGHDPSPRQGGRVRDVHAKDKKARLERQRMLLEWDSRSNYRTDLAESEPGRVSAFSPALFSSDSHPSSSKYIPVTAVILSWKRKEGAKAVVAHLRKYPFFKEILIWNNNPEVVLTAKDFADWRRPLDSSKDDGTNGQRLEETSVVVFNSVANLHDFSKYTTCSLAKYDHCYIQDDDWINLSLDSMYSLFMDQPNSLVTSTIPAMYAQQRKWMFHNAQIGLHTGFSWLGAGSFMPKQTVFRFLQQLGGSNLWKERVQLSDLFFSLWRNQYPVVLSHALAPLDQSSSWSGRIDQWSVVYEHMVTFMAFEDQLRIQPLSISI